LVHVFDLIGKPNTVLIIITVLLNSDHKFFAVNVKARFQWDAADRERCA
jgi:hypothetical protein